MGVITGYPDDTSTTDSDKFLTSDSSGATKLTTASTLKDYVLADGNITTAMIADGTIQYADLLSTIFSGQLTTYVNPGTAGGTFYYINLGGIKLLWGRTDSKSVGTGGATYYVTFPASFFTTIQSVSVTLDSLGVEARQWCRADSITTSTLGIHQISTTNGSTQKNSVLIIGT